MGRITEMITYIKSSPKEWHTGKIQYSMFYHYLITPQAKKLRRELKLYQPKTKQNQNK